MESVLEKLHKDRLAEKNIVIEDMFSRHGEILVRSTDGQRNDNVVNCPRIEKRYFHNNKFIYAEKNFDKNTNYTFYFGHNDDSLSCPNCGYESKVKLKHNDDISNILKNGYKVIQCENCGASIEITADECEYCRTPIKFKNEWIIEEFTN